VWYCKYSWRIHRAIKIYYYYYYYYYYYEDESKTFRTDAVRIINLTRSVWKLPTSTHLRATWHTDLLDMIMLPSTSASRYYNCCINVASSPEYFGWIHPRINYSTGRDSTCRISW
jgi:hypothetical protein